MHLVKCTWSRHSSVYSEHAFYTAPRPEWKQNLGSPRIHYFDKWFSSFEAVSAQSLTMVNAALVLCSVHAKGNTNGMLLCISVFL